jgi:autotransporter-associated beta strand protein
MRMVMAVLTLALLAGGEAGAANIWDGGGTDDNWGTANNWDNNTVPSFPVALTLSGMTRLTPNNETAGRTVNGFTFSQDAGAFTIGGNAFTLGGNIVNNATAVQTINNDITLSATRTVTANAGGADIILGGVIGQSSSGYGLTKTGTGTLTLKGNNTFTGTVTLNGTGGRLVMGHANALGLGTGAIALTAGTLDPGDADRTITNAITFAAHTIAGTNNLTLTGKVTGSGNWTLTSSLDPGKVLTLSNNVSSGGGNVFTLAGTGDTTISGVYEQGSMMFRNRGTTTIGGTNAYAGYTEMDGGGTVILDYGASGGDGSKLANTVNGLYLSGGYPSGSRSGGTDLILKGGTHTEVVPSTYIGVGSAPRGHVNVTRQGGSATLQMNVITFGGDTINFSEDDIATTDNANGASGILNSYATVGGTDWAYNSGGADGLIRRLPAGSYTTLPASGGSSAVNYVLNGSFTQTGLNDINTLKIVPTADGQTLRSAPTA